jgi:hypothetical protein
VTAVYADWLTKSDFADLRPLAGHQSGRRDMVTARRWITNRQ